MASSGYRLVDIDDGYAAVEAPDGSHAGHVRRDQSGRWRAYDASGGPEPGITHPRRCDAVARLAKAVEELRQKEGATRGE